MPNKKKKPASGTAREIQAQEMREWLKARARGVGGSDIGAIARKSDWKTPFDVWLDKRPEGGVEPPPSSLNRLRRGRVMEKFIRELVEEDEGMRIYPPGHLKGPEDWILATPDGYVYDNPGRGEEIKTTTEWAYKESWGAPGTEQVPVVYALQCLWYMGAETAEEKTRYAVRVMPIDRGSGEIYDTFWVPRDDRKIVALQTIGRRFWQDYVLAGVPPLPPADDDQEWARLNKGLNHYYRREVVRLVEADQDTMALARAYDRARADEKRWGMIKDAARARLMVALGENQGAKWDGGKVTAKAPKDRVRVNHAKVGQMLVQALDRAVRDVADGLDESIAATIRTAVDPMGTYELLLKENTTTTPADRVMRVNIAAPKGGKGEAK